MNGLFAEILASFEQTAAGNFTALHRARTASAPCIDCGKSPCDCCIDCGCADCICEPYDHEAAMEAQYGPYVEGERPGDSL